MTQHRLLYRLQPIFRDILDPSLVLTDDLDASTVPQWDSLNHISLVVAIESEFGVEISAEELSELRNVGDFAKLLASKVEQQV